jgi:hypothetical protein
MSRDGEIFLLQPGCKDAHLQPRLDARQSQVLNLKALKPKSHQ